MVEGKRWIRGADGNRGGHRTGRGDVRKRERGNKIRKNYRDSNKKGTPGIFKKKKSALTEQECENSNMTHAKEC